MPRRWSTRRRPRRRRRRRPPAAVVDAGAARGRRTQADAAPPAGEPLLALRAAAVRGHCTTTVDRRTPATGRRPARPGRRCPRRRRSPWPGGADADRGETMRRIGGAIADLPNAVRVEGHTDDVPIHTARFTSNWELSTARATRSWRCSSANRRSPPTGCRRPATASSIRARRTVRRGPRAQPPRRHRDPQPGDRDQRGAGAGEEAAR